MPLIEGSVILTIKCDLLLSWDEIFHCIETIVATHIQKEL